MPILSALLLLAQTVTQPAVQFDSPHPADRQFVAVTWTQSITPAVRFSQPVATVSLAARTP